MSELDNPLAATDASNMVLDLDNMDLSTVATGMPMIPECLCELEVTKVELKANKAGNGQNLHIEYATTQPITSVEGRLLNPGFKVFDLIPLTPTEKYDPKVRLAEFKEATTGSKAGAFNPLEQYLNARVTVRIKIERSEEFGNKNRIGRYIKKG